MHAVVPIVLALSINAPVPSSMPPAPTEAPAPCAWSDVLRRIQPPESAPDAVRTAPRLKKGRFTRPHSTVQREIQGHWEIEVVVDAAGRVRDAAVVVRPRVEPAWPEIEQAMLADARKLRFEPARASGAAVASCARFELIQKWNEWE